MLFYGESCDCPLSINGKSRAELPSLLETISLPLNRVECELRDLARRDTEVTHGFRHRAPIQGRFSERHPLGQRLHPCALMHATILHTGCRRDEQRCEHLEVPPDGGDTTRIDRPRFGHGARGTGSLDTAGAREGCHTVGSASGLLRTCLAS